MKQFTATIAAAALVPLVWKVEADADQTVIPDYHTARDHYVYPQLYPSGGKTIYCNKPFSGRSHLQVEHVLPASWLKEAGRCTSMTRKQCRATSKRFNHLEADLHNLWPAMEDANQRRSNYLFGIIGEDTIDNWKGFCDFQFDKEARLVEPRAEIRGEIARMVLYMVNEYDVQLPDGQHELMVSWHCEDNIPSGEEIRRNRVIADLQGTRNPYIDNPSLLCDTGEVGDNHPDSDVWEDCEIKGNIGKGGKRIYHMPSSPHYASTRINESKGERWFCTEAEARNAGWRAPR